MYKLAAVISVLVACGSSSTTLTDAAGSNSTGAMLTVKNYESWCSVAIGSAAASSNATQTISVLPGTFTLTATALSGFELGSNMWHLVDGDSGSGVAGTVSGSASTASVTVAAGSGAKCVWVCCPFTNGTGCNVADQCP